MRFQTGSKPVPTGSKSQQCIAMADPTRFQTGSNRFQITAVYQKLLIPCGSKLAPTSATPKLSLSSPPQMQSKAWAEIGQNFSGSAEARTQIFCVSLKAGQEKTVEMTTPWRSSSSSSTQETLNNTWDSVRQPAPAGKRFE